MAAHRQVGVGSRYLDDLQILKIGAALHL